MRYIMVTSFEKHWDNIPGNRTSYPKHMFRRGMNKNKLVNDMKTIFIKKRNKEDPTIEKCWEGKVYDFEETRRGDKEVIYFRIEIQKEINCPKEYLEYEEGWYSEEEPAPKNEEPMFEPPFFAILNSTADWDEFEKYSYYLLKCIGLHALYKFPLREQKGKADGFFIFGKLIVMFDMTLKRDFEKDKEIQIDNFCSQLKKGSIQYGKQKFTISNYAKQVWIITKGGEPRLIKKEDGILVKEVPVTKIEELFGKRLIEDLDEEGFERCLCDLGSS